MAATVRFWNQGKVTINNAASWQDGIGGASAVPLVSNIVYFANGTDNITSGLAALSGVKLQHAAMNRGFKGNVGGNGQSLLLSVNSTGAGVYASSVFEYGAGAGRAYVAAASGGIGVVRNTSLGNLFFTAGTINVRAELNSGNTTLGSSVDLSGKLVEVSGGENVIEYKSDGTDPTITVTGGSLTLRRPAGTLTINGGTVNLEVEQEANGFATLNMNGGTLNWICGAAATAVNLNDGYVTFKALRRPLGLGSATVTAANTEIDRQFSPGAKITWPATSAIIFKSGKAAEAFARVAAATV